MKIKNRRGQPLPDQIENMLLQFVERSVHSCESHIKKIILFGSYARGDFGTDSDIDIMVLVDFPREQLGGYMSIFSDISFDISFDHDFFNQWIASFPFYHNVRTEGVQLYG